MCDFVVCLSGMKIVLSGWWGWISMSFSPRRVWFTKWCWAAFGAWTPRTLCNLSIAGIVCMDEWSPGWWWIVLFPGLVFGMRGIPRCWTMMGPLPCSVFRLVCQYVTFFFPHCVLCLCRFSPIRFLNTFPGQFSQVARFNSWQPRCVYAWPQAFIGQPKPVPGYR